MTSLFYSCLFSASAALLEWSTSVVNASFWKSFARNLLNSFNFFTLSSIVARFWEIQLSVHTLSQLLRRRVRFAYTQRSEVWNENPIFREKLLRIQSFLYEIIQTLRSLVVGDSRRDLKGLKLEVPLQMISAWSSPYQLVWLWCQSPCFFFCVAPNCFNPVLAKCARNLLVERFKLLKSHRKKLQTRKSPNGQKFGSLFSYWQAGFDRSLVYY